MAELEATTARKGNRKVSLEVSGHINEGVLFWDDGWESNAYVVTNDNSRSRFRFRGKAKINSDWEAGYRLEIGVRSSNSKRFTQSGTVAAAFDLRDSHWYVKSKTYGTVAVGLQSTATDGITEINQAQTRDFAKYSDIEDTGLGLNLRRRDGALATSTAGGASAYSYYTLLGGYGDQPGDGEKRFNGVRYTTPEISGFTASAFWGQDDYWDVSLAYSGEHAGFKIEAGLGYGEITDGTQTQTACASIGGVVVGSNADAKCSQFGGSLSVLHSETGLYANFAAGIKKDDLINQTNLFSLRNANDEQTFWAAEVGIERKWNSLGKTTVYGQYYHYEGGGSSRRIAGAFAGTANAAAVVETGVESYGFGLAQGIDAAALTLYLSYRHVEGELGVVNTDGAGRAVAGAASGVPLEDLNLVFAGGIIKF
ncbi:porin [Hyphomicrobium sulfonivorans]|uniref:Porin domain-containing protein n=1 Tax=Hyphomicrobium sulfonivorans TaxID=121290 RepID=A0A109BBY9_HYPSL|nr:outer membrane beta-barrel protein [Hyphomicrobium sulfonivorans]KWT65989.1 hypothetical protein APY04_2576 [Hyphomicrobium sulfonivorans]